MNQNTHLEIWYANNLKNCDYKCNTLIEQAKEEVYIPSAYHNKSVNQTKFPSILFSMRRDITTSK